MGDPEYIIRDISNLDDYLFESQSMFDCLDFVFMDGDPNLLPWMPKAEKFALLFKACKATNKTFFSAGIGLTLLVYYCATSFANLKIVNGHGKGSNISDINTMNEKCAGRQEWIDEAKRNEVFLDNATGDYYTFRKDLEVWAPIGNIGLHYAKAAEAHGSNAEALKKVKTYKTKSLNPMEQIYISKLTEKKVIVKKEYLQHWAVESCGGTFLSCSKNQWDAHPTNLTSSNLETVKTNYQVLAESENGP